MNFLIELVPAGGRKVLYALLTFGLALYAIYQASDGDWVLFAFSVASGLVAALATANTHVGKLPPDDYPNGYNQAILDEGDYPDGYDQAVRDEGGYVSATSIIASIVVVLLILALISMLGWI